VSEWLQKEGRLTRLADRAQEARFISSGCAVTGLLRVGRSAALTDEGIWFFIEAPIRRRVQRAIPSLFRRDAISAASYRLLRISARRKEVRRRNPHVPSDRVDEPIDMRAGAERLLASVVRVFGAAQVHHGYLFANARATRVKLLVHDGFGVWCASRRLNCGRSEQLRADSGP
jgi:IS66 Orf2 like protein